MDEKINDQLQRKLNEIKKNNGNEKGLGYDDMIYLFFINLLNEEDIKTDG